MCARVERLAAEVEPQLLDGIWEFTPQDAVLAGCAAEGVADAVGAATEQERLPVLDRLEHLREVLAVLAIGIARTHGQLAWFLTRASTVLAPVLHWRSLPANPRRSFCTTVPTPGELADAEEASRLLRTLLVHLGAVAVVPPAGGPRRVPGPHPGPAPTGPETGALA
ncbi:hypothetical protein ACFV1W_28855 [Kitasatospora sp. NPDC059648]|uniref:hypothetical protein n=1 Tax=Kitasatospora sp. NPDC059648 TaxID=3346894 RepID=UPI0036CE66A4